MDPRAVFDKFLLQEDMEGAFNWVTEKLAWDPESIHLRGMTAFAFRLNNQYWVARVMAEEVLKEDPCEEWALATVFSTTNNLDLLFTQFSFFNEGSFRLSHDWIGRFHCLKQEDEARKLIYCLSRYGSPLQKVELSEDWLVSKGIQEYGEKQLELVLESKDDELGKSKKGKSKR